MCSIIASVTLHLVSFSVDYKQTDRQTDRQTEVPHNVYPSSDFALQWPA